MKSLPACGLMAIFILLAQGALSAQSTFALHGGLNFGTIQYSGHSGAPYFQEGYELGHFYGISLRHALSNHFAVGLDAQFSLKASRLRYDNPFISTVSIRQQRSAYLEVVPRVEYFFNKHLGLSVGLYGAYLLAEYIKVDDGAWFVARSTPLYDPKDNDWDMGLSPGISLRFGRVLGFIRYNHGLVPLGSFQFTDEQGNDAGTARLFDRQFQAGLGYVIFD